VTKPTLDTADNELTLVDYLKLGGDPKKLRNGGKRNRCVSYDNGEHVFRCAKCRTWNCDCHGSCCDLCDVCWCEKNPS
jgi:hypothetical protein